MERVIEKSLRANISKEVTELNSMNSQFQALIRRLKECEYTASESLGEKLDHMKTDIRDKIRALAGNVDMLYQILDRKICVIAAKIDKEFFKDSRNSDQEQHYNLKIKEMGNQINLMQIKNQQILAQNQHLRKQNILLIAEIQEMSLKKWSGTNESSNEESKGNEKRSHENSLQFYKSPLDNGLLKGQSNIIENGINKRYKKFRSEQNSYSRQIREQNSSYDFGKGDGKFGYGCMPVRSREHESFTLSKQHRYKHEQNINENHRLEFLINNLQGSQELNSQENSLSSQGLVKKYQI